MLLPKFKVGEEVTNEYGVRYKIIAIRYSRAENCYEYTLTGWSAHSPVYKLERDLKFYYEESVTKKLIKELPKNCPRCGNPWKKTGFGTQIWYDCSSCKRKAEDLV